MVSETLFLLLLSSMYEVIVKTDTWLATKEWVFGILSIIHNSRYINLLDLFSTFRFLARMNKVSVFKETKKITELISEKKYKIMHAKEIDTKFGRSIVINLRELENPSTDSEDDDDFKLFLPKRWCITKQFDTYL